MRRARFAITAVFALNGLTIERRIERVGFIAGPPAIGGLAALVGLRAALALVVVCLTAAAVLAGAVRTPRRG